MSDQGEPSALTPQTIAPPRPNLGPEPMPEPVTPAWVWLIPAALMLGVMLWLRRRMRTRKAATSAPTLVEPPAREPEPPDLDALTPRERLIQQAELLRQALVERFGPGWAAKTTEEIAAEPELAAFIEAEPHAQVVELLARADRAKFAPKTDHEPDPHRDDDAWLPAVLAALAGSAGATSRINGK